ncbi:endolytic transglycosylase MltG [Ruminococcus sp. Marseille-P6503]|uniref:endolytic transglycosylase MltG n=1 Tax=Ruminococcus sp. Marseille-P6503 TaxID=2364796 RepID=UPI001FA9947B|nr:endolytic transglycosylase MltG [Ruminococcus sp. Marseille-P6503]
MDKKDFSVDDIINDVNAKKLEKASADELKKNGISAEDKDSDRQDALMEPDIDENASSDDQQDESINEISESVDLNENTESSENQNDTVKPEINTDTPEQPTEVKSGKPVDEIPKRSDKKNVHKKKKRKKKNQFNTSIFSGLIIVIIILTVSLVIAIGGISLGMEYTGMGKSENEVTFNIPKNSTTDDIAQILVDNQIIKNKTLFKIAMRLKSSPTIYPGDITLHPSMGYAAVIDELATMRESYETVTVTFQEGLTLLDAANLLQENGVCSADDFLFEFNKKQDFSFEDKITENEDAFYRMEGFFFPDTYEFYVGDSAYNVTRIIREHFEDKITDKMYEQMEEKNLTLSEVMTLASIIQWEANSAEDMPKVASVFLNRLDDSDTFPSLQSDATKNYIEKVIVVKADNDASIDHFSDSYDTYECQGLPAGPVCNPGLDAINAVLNPEDTNYYYFCNNLETGESFFAETLEEHEENLKKAGLA